MSFNRSDLRRMLWPLVFLCAAILFAGLMSSMTETRKTNAQRQVKEQENVLVQARQKYRTSGQEKEDIAQYLPKYQKLVDRGFIGEERRIDWIDNLRSINQRYKFFGIRYTIETQEIFHPKFSLDTGKFKLHRSVMKISLDLLHERDLPTLLNALSQENTSPFMIRSCIVERIGAGSLKFQPNLRATCDLDWLTISEPPIIGGTS